MLNTCFSVCNVNVEKLPKKMGLWMKIYITPSIQSVWTFNWVGRGEASWLVYSTPSMISFMIVYTTYCKFIKTLTGVVVEPISAVSIYARIHR